MRAGCALTLATAAACLAGCGSHASGGGHATASAPALIAAYGCGACHTIPGVEGANGKVGPSLSGLGDRRSIAGRLANTTENLSLWISRPQQVDPGNLMPDLGVDRRNASEIAAFLDRQ